MVVDQRSGASQQRVEAVWVAKAALGKVDAALATLAAQLQQRSRDTEGSLRRAVERLREDATALALTLSELSIDLG
jgi:hypothetical protein